MTEFVSEPRRWTIYGFHSEHETEVQLLRDAWDREVESANEARAEMEGLGTILRGPVHGLLQTIRGMCSDECSYPEIDRALSRLDDLILGAIGDQEGGGYS